MIDIYLKQINGISRKFSTDDKYEVKQIETIEDEELSYKISMNILNASGRAKEGCTFRAGCFREFSVPTRTVRILRDNLSSVLECSSRVKPPSAEFGWLALARRYQ